MDPVVIAGIFAAAASVGAGLLAVAKSIATYGTKIVVFLTVHQERQREMLDLQREVNVRLGRVENLLAAERTVHLGRGGLRVETSEKESGR